MLPIKSQSTQKGDARYDITEQLLTDKHVHAVLRENQH